MRRDPARVFVFGLSFFSLLEGGASLVAHASSGASEFLSFIHKMNALHGGLHVANGVVGMAFLLAGSQAAVTRFSMAFGVVYAALGVVGAVAHAGGNGALGLELIGPDHLLHIVIGLVGVAAARRSELNARMVVAS